MEGHIKLYRKFLDWQWYKDINTSRLFLHMLLKANWKPRQHMGVDVPRGSLSSTYEELAKETGLSIKNVRTAVKRLENGGEVAVKRHQKFTVFSIKNYDKYQSSGSQTADERQSDGSQAAVPIKEEREESNNINNNKNHNVSPPTSGGHPAYPYEDIVDYLNLKAGTKFRQSSEDTRKHIRARINDGYTIDDFKAVIDKKVSEWKGTDREIYLRPSTLFGTKFESYLNQKRTVSAKPTPAPNRFHNFEQRDTDYDAIALQRVRERINEGNNGSIG